VERLGSLQAQHPEWPPIALAVRAADRRTADLAAALGQAEADRVLTLITPGDGRRTVDMT
jgi:hypothetical protein